MSRETVTVEKAAGGPPLTMPPRAGPHLGIVRALTVALALGGMDAAIGMHAFASPLLTAVQSAFFVPWAWIVMGARRHGESAPGRGVPGLALHATAIAVVAACLTSKWVVLGGPGDAGALPAEAYRAYAIGGTLAAAVGLVARGARLARLLVAIGHHPARLMLASFGATALLGGFVLTLPVCVRQIGGTNFVDALFMATSAVCVTGLVVHDVAGTYTAAGQGVLLLLIQVGGLGIMVMSTFLVIVAGQRLRVRSAAILAEATFADNFSGLRRAVVTIVLATLAIEAVGAAALYAALSRHPEVAVGPESGAPLAGAGSLLWAAVFHSVSAFCNAGLSLFRANLSPLATDLPVNLIVAVLVSAGGIGFPVLAELGRRLARFRGERGPRLSLHARTVLATSAALVVVLASAILALEWSRSLGHLPWAGRVVAALFHSVSARTAGFNTVDVGAMRPATWLLLCAFMFVGASPGSTGGGIKTSTLAALAASLRAVVRGEGQARLFDRALPAAVVNRAIGVTFASGMLLSTFAFLLLLTERAEPLRVVFEVVSAFATVGYSTGITTELSGPGRLLVVLAMLVGRVGPMTMALVFADRQHTSAVKPVEERVLVG